MGTKEPGTVASKSSLNPVLFLATTGLHRRITSLPDLQLQVV
jgi:hypothetical protein